MPFSKEMAGLEDEGRTVGIVYSVFRKVFSTISCSIFLEKMRMDYKIVDKVDWKLPKLQ